MWQVLIYVAKGPFDKSAPWNPQNLLGKGDLHLSCRGGVCSARFQVRGYGRTKALPYGVMQTECFKF